MITRLALTPGFHPAHGLRYACARLDLYTAQGECRTIILWLN